MAISTYSELQAAVADWLNRSDLTVRIPDFIQLAESAIRRRLRQSTVVAPLTLQAEETPLPADVSEVRYLRHKGTHQFPIEITTPVAVADLRAVYGNGTGVPRRAAILGSTLYVAPVPDQAYPVELTYFDTLVPLSMTTPTNSVLTQAPDVYLAGTLVEAYVYLEYEERIPFWKEKFERAIEELNTMRERAEFGAAPMLMRLPLVIG